VRRPVIDCHITVMRLWDNMSRNLDMKDSGIFRDCHLSIQTDIESQEQSIC